LCGFAELGDLQTAHRQWVALERLLDRRWQLAFVETVKNDLGIKAMHREALETDGTCALREPAEAYAPKLTGRNEALSSENTLPWNESLENPGT
jgi:hypothetical protein